MDALYCVELESEDEGSRTFIFNAEDDRDAENLAKTFANEWLDDRWSLVGWGPAIDYISGGILEICTW